jgi:hypothetical protein
MESVKVLTAVFLVMLALSGLPMADQIRELENRLKEESAFFSVSLEDFKAMERRP